MASDLAAPPPPQVPQHEEFGSDPAQPAASLLDATINGDHPSMTSTSNSDGLVKGGEITANEDHIPPTTIDTDIPDAVQGGPSPVDQVDSGIAPIANFIPKETANVSHPTPPPDLPLASGTADMDVEMVNAEDDVQTPAESEPYTQPISAQTEQSLVRPREDDGEDQPAAKRSRVEEPPLDTFAEESVSSVAPVLEQVVETGMNVLPERAVKASEIPVVATTTETAVEPTPDPAAEASNEPLVMDATETVVEPVVEPVVESAPAIESSSQQPETTAVQPPPEETTLPKVETDSLPVNASAASKDDAEVAAAATEAQNPVMSSTQAAAEAPQEIAAPQAAQKSTYSSVPITSVQKSFLLEKMKNLKKTKNSMVFLKPVDPVALNIPTYFDIITKPMDLGTMESKLKDGKYSSVQEFADDFDLIISNTRRFNGDAHAVTQAGLAMEAYFRRMMEHAPGPEQQALVQAEKGSPSIATEKPRREPRIVPPPAPAPAAQSEAFALHSDGTPQIRRQSSISNRPARAIKPPQNREIAYSKPKRKEHQLELRFCDHLLDELKTPKYHATNHVFMFPVDPVALNIPNYRSVVRHPMDLSTMSQKLKAGQYANAAEFKKDFDLIIQNCLAFNPIGNPVRDLGIQFQRQFEELWQGKEKWERKNQPVSNRASSASGDEESGGDDDEEEDEGPDDKEATIRSLQAQLVAMQNALSGLGDKPAKSKKAKPTKTANKKAAGSTSLVPAKKASAKPAAKPKKAKIVSYEEKQEISEAVNKMDEKQVGRLTEIITQNCAKYREMDEMELEIDDLPNEVQAMLLEYVRKLFGNPNKKKAREPSPDDAAALDDDDYEEKGGARGGKRKKHRPMGKKEQEETINSIKSQLAQFSQAATSGSESPTAASFNVANAQADTSGDEESEESEEE